MTKCAWAALGASRTDAPSRPSGTRPRSESHSIYEIKRQPYESEDHSTRLTCDRGRQPRPGSGFRKDGSRRASQDRPPLLDQGGVVSPLFNFRAVHHPARAVCPAGAGSGRWVAGRPAGQLGATDTDAFELPRRKTPHMQVVPVHGGFGVVALELKLKSRLVAAHGFTAHRAGCTHPRSAPHAVRPSRRQPPAADRVSGFFAKDGFVRNCRGSQSHGRRSEPDATRPDARVRHLGARWKAIQRTPHRKVALPVGVREREPGTVSACSTGAHEPRSVGRSQPGGYA